MPCRVFNSVSGLYLIDARGTTFPHIGDQKRLQTLPGVPGGVRDTRQDHPGKNRGCGEMSV